MAHHCVCNDAVIERYREISGESSMPGDTTVSSSFLEATNTEASQATVWLVGLGV